MSVGKEADDRFVNLTVARNRNWAARAAWMLRRAIVQSLPEQVRSPLPPWDNVSFRELFLFLPQAVSIFVPLCAQPIGR